MRTRIIRGRQLVIDRGASAVEYGLLVAAIATIIVGVVFGLGGVVEAAFQQTQDCLVANQSAPGCPPQPVEGP
jgi:Flp pilus assembly pilin Flp